MQVNLDVLSVLQTRNEKTAAATPQCYTTSSLYIRRIARRYTNELEASAEALTGANKESLDKSPDIKMDVLFFLFVKMFLASLFASVFHLKML